MSQSVPITAELREALHQAAGGPVFIVDPLNGEEIVVLRAEDYKTLAHGFDISETYLAQNAALAAIWDDPALDDYNDADCSESA